jgi:hypothetical protein
MLYVKKTFPPPSCREMHGEFYKLVILYALSILALFTSQNLTPLHISNLNTLAETLAKHKEEFKKQHELMPFEST